ncbi:MAG: hypothetical protein K9G60_02120 [Pseudolabrys sp.]|nr:hypothetical protein [Pseudolabrys sp.]
MFQSSMLKLSIGESAGHGLVTDDIDAAGTFRRGVGDPLDRRNADETGDTEQGIVVGCGGCLFRRATTGRWAALRIATVPPALPKLLAIAYSRPGSEPVTMEHRFFGIVRS